MANPHPQKVDRVRDIEMPTRERLLSLIKILQDFDKDRPIKKKDIAGLLYFEYCNYILSQLGKELQKAGCKDYEEAGNIIYWLKNENDIDFKITERKLYSRNTISGDEKILQRAAPEDVRREKYDRLIEIAENTDFGEKRLAYTEGLINALYDIEDGSIIDCASTATLAADMSVLMDEDYDYVRSTGRAGISPTERGVYGRYEHNLLDIWQIKIINEAMSGIRFLRASDVDELADIISCVTSKQKLEDAQSICHQLEKSYYSRSTLFRENLKLIISAHVHEYNVSFNYQYSTVDRDEKLLDPRSPYQVFPVDIVFKDNFFYLLGATEEKVRPYRIDRIIDLVQANYNKGFMKKHKDFKKEKDIFYRNNTNNFSGGDEVEVIVRWDLYYNDGRYTPYTPLFDVFGYENISQGTAEDQFTIKTRDNYGMYLNLLRLGPVIEIVEPVNIRKKYSDLVRRMHEKHSHQ